MSSSLLVDGVFSEHSVAIHHPTQSKSLLLRVGVDATVGLTTADYADNPHHGRILLEFGNLEVVDSTFCSAADTFIAVSQLAGVG